MATYVGRLAKVTIGTVKIAEMGTWSLDGITMDMIDDSEFGDTFKTFAMGMGDYGTISFSGWWDMSDSTGQKALESAQLNVVKLTSLRFYVNNTSYYTPNTNTTTGSNGNVDAGMYVQSMKVSFEKGSIGKIDFTCKATGPLVLL